MIRIKVCGLTDSLNAREMAEAGADYLGFIFYRDSKRYVGDCPAGDLFLNIPENTRKVGVFVNEEPERIFELADRFSLHAVQLHGQETTGFCQTIRQGGIQVIKAFGIDEDFDFNLLEPFLEACDFFLFDAHTRHHGGSGMKFPWQKLRNYVMNKPFFLSGGIGPEDVQVIRRISHRALYAADINSRFEKAPGIKNTMLVRTFIQDIKTRVL